jgi:hypothetical protein
MPIELVAGFVANDQCQNSKMIFRKPAAAHAELEARRAQPRAQLTVSFAPSLRQRQCEIALCMVCAAFIPAAQIGWFWVGFSCCALAAYAWWSGQRARALPFTELILAPDDQLLLRCPGELEATPATLIAPLFVSPWGIALRVVRTGAEPRARPLVLTPDQIPAAQFRALRVRLRHIRNLDDV